ncbi:MAG TPA: branched-chain amino acid ABC transporter permease [Xanthobacteraceae bacterium]|nr:branched-chain amino acid ABC transporter permease [Xanthobacteraceae bacterium]
MDPLVVTQAINVLYAVSTLAVLALGLAVIFGLLGVLNIAHGEFIMIGAYCAYLVQSWDWPYLAAVPLTLAVCALLGIVVEWVMIRPLYRRPFDTLVATWGLSLLLRKIAEAIFGSGFRSLTIPLPGTVRFLGVEYPLYRLTLIATSVAVIAVLALWYGRSRTGTRIRAMVSNPELAQAQGISVRRLAAATFVTGTCLAGLGGVMVAPLVPVQPFMGLDYVLRAFFVLIVGGLGSVPGVLSGAAAIGGIDSAVSATTNATDGYFAVLLLSILFLWLRPRGLVARG